LIELWPISRWRLGAAFGGTYAHPEDVWLAVFFTPTEKSQAAGRASLKRFRLRQEGRDPEVNEKVASAQIEAISKWGAPRAGAFDYLRGFSTQRW
jgi:hypothetical protein